MRGRRGFHQGNEEMFGVLFAERGVGFEWEQTRKPERMYSYVLAALAILLGMWSFPALRHVSANSLAFFCVLGTLAGISPIYLHRGGSCPTTVVVGYMVILVHGAAVALWTTGVAALAATAIRRFRRVKAPGDRYDTWHIPQECLAAGLAGLAFEVVGGTPSVSVVAQVPVPLAVGGLVYFLVWVFFDAVGELLRRGVQPLRFWLARANYLLGAYAALLVFSFWMARLFVHPRMGMFGSFVLLSMLLLVSYSTRLYVGMKDVYLSTIYALAATAEASSMYTCGHSERVAGYAVAVAYRMGLPEREIADIEYAALLHDIGKVGIKEDVLRKKGPLTEEEMAKVEEHPVLGMMILGQIDFLRRAARLVRHHHERYDGGGYPDGLSGKEIPLGARVLAVANAFDAMTSRRPYKEALSLYEAEEELERCAGTQFDPEVVSHFLSVLKTEPKYRSSIASV